MLNESHKKDLSKVCQHEVLKGRSENPFSHQRVISNGKYKYSRLHKGRNHNTYDYVQLKDVIKVFIKRCRLAEYVNDGRVS